MIEFHATMSPNALKVAIILKELDQDYELVKYDIAAGRHLLPEFCSLNPNHRLPVIRDRKPKEGSGPITVFESGAILLYLAEKTGKFLSSDFALRTVTQQWLMWQMAAFGPTAGQLGHYLRHCPHDEPYSMKRYADEVERLLDVLEYRLSEAEYLAGEYSIADMAVWPVAVGLSFIGVNAADRPSTARWLTAIADRIAVPNVTRTMLDEIAGRRDFKGTDERARTQWAGIFGQISPPQ